LQFGRKTTKNVAGYDVTKLAVGSRGRLGAITQVTLRLKPSAGPWWCGQWEHDSLSEALTIALAMAKTPVRPDGLAIVRNAQSPTFQLLVYAANQRYQELQTHWPAMTWQPADAMYPQHEAARLEALYTAWQAGRYRVQAALPTQLGDRLQAIAASGQTIWVYPSLGLYELFDAEPAVEGVDEVVLRMAENVRQVFDPHQLFEG
jgi:D-lactate dehydrogenase (cytochrome)/glycolate oxidase